tara:strand:- start:48350 stop:48535 length:186 start_codon:yes stop_codon:yes gene_type:complete
MPATQKKQKTTLTRYRVTLDFSVNDANCVRPSDWNWKDLLELKGKERVKSVYVENLGQFNA